MYVGRYTSNLVLINIERQEFSVTRFGEIPPVKQIFKNIWQYIYGLFGFGLLTHFGTIRMLLGEFSLLQMAKY